MYLGPPCVLIKYLHVAIEHFFLCSFDKCFPFHAGITSPFLILLERVLPAFACIYFTRAMPIRETDVFFPIARLDSAIIAGFPIAFL